MSRPQMDVSKLWLQAALLTFVIGFSGLGLLAAKISDHAPIPATVVDPSGRVVFTDEDVIAGQQIFQKFGLMQYGSIYGHGAYLGPDFAAQYLHAAALDMLARYGETDTPLPNVRARVIREWKENRHDERSNTLTFSEGQTAAYEAMVTHYTTFFGSQLRARLLARP